MDNTQYGCHTRHLQKLHSRLQTPNKNPFRSKRASRSHSNDFTDERRLNLSVKLQATWRPAHNCHLSAVCALSCGHLSRGEASIHIGADHLESLKEDTKEPVYIKQDLQLTYVIISSRTNFDTLLSDHFTGLEDANIVDHVKILDIEVYLTPFTAVVHDADLTYTSMALSPLSAVKNLHLSLRISNPSNITGFYISAAQVTRPQEKTVQSSELGFCIDVGAFRSVINQCELSRILTSSAPHHRRVAPCQFQSRFADSTYDSLGQISLPLTSPSGLSSLSVDTDIVSANGSALLGMSVRDNKAFTPCKLSNRLGKLVKCTGQDGEEAFVEKWNMLAKYNCHHVGRLVL